MMMTATRCRWRAVTRLGALALLTGAGAAGLTGASAGVVTPQDAPQTWSVQKLPRYPDPSGGLNAVSCASAAFCIATGAVDAAWNGSTWQLTSLSHSDPAFVPLDVSCASAAFCMAVGVQEDVPAAATWDGTSWSSTQTWSYRGRLYGVSCPTTTACLAVGENDFGHRGGTHPIAEQWNGGQWKLAPIPGRTSLPGALTAVSCSAPGACTAAGSYRKPQQDVPLIERWDGTSLTPQQSADPTASVATVSVSCPAADGCVLLGAGSGAAYLQFWDGAQWAAMNPPDTGGLSSVSCSSSADCLAVGSRTGAQGQPAALGLRWSGGTWSVAQPKSMPGPGTSLTGVSCPAAARCAAVGDYESRFREPRSLAELWTGTRWRIQHTPNGRATYAQAEFSGVACATATATACAAIGTFQTDYGSPAPLAAFWDGTRWAYPESPRTIGQYTQPDAISCPAAGMCMAVGTYASASIFDQTYPWAAIWRGRHWQTVTPPRPPSTEFYQDLSSVSCATATSCVAVGETANGGNQISYAWNGTGWTLLPVPTGVTGGYLNGVSCVTATDCLAVGSGSGSTWLAQSWDGQTWTVLPTSGDPEIDAISCTAATACTAVGDSTVARRPAIERWNGTSWTAQKAALSPPDEKFTELNGVSCATATACTAVGYYWNGQADNTTLPFIQSWNGTRWATRRAPDTGYSDLYSAACPALSTCIAAGVQNTTSLWAPLAESSG